MSSRVEIVGPGTCCTACCTSPSCLRAYVQCVGPWAGVIVGRPRRPHGVTVWDLGRLGAHAQQIGVGGWRAHWAGRKTDALHVATRKPRGEAVVLSVPACFTSPLSIDGMGCISSPVQDPLRKELRTKHHSMRWKRVIGLVDGCTAQLPTTWDPNQLLHFALDWLSVSPPSRLWKCNPFAVDLELNSTKP